MQQYMQQFNTQATKPLCGSLVGIFANKSQLVFSRCVSTFSN